MIATPLMDILGWTLLHSVWQVILLASMFAIAQWLMRDHGAQARYLLTAGTLAGMLAAPVGTGAWMAANSSAPDLRRSLETHAVAADEPQATGVAPLPRSSSGRPVMSDIILDDEIGHTGKHPAGTKEAGSMTSLREAPGLSSAAQGASVATRLESWLPGLVIAWLTGVLLLSIRHLGGWWAIGRLRRRGSVPAIPALHAQLDRLAVQVKVRRSVELLESVLIQVPSVVGWLRPAILLPLGLATRIPASQLEAILLHELAHIRRNDYLANALQIVVETLLFYHPVVWWVSCRMRLERECCADEIAAANCNSRLLYAKALATLEEQRAAATWGVAANGSDLRHRIERVLGLPRPQDGSAGQRATGTLILLLGLFTVAFSWWYGNAHADAPPPFAEGQQSSATGTAAEATVSEITAAVEVGDEPVAPAVEGTKESQLPTTSSGLFAHLDDAWPGLIEEFVESVVTTFRSEPIAHEYDLHVVTTENKPVPGATVTLTGVGLHDGSSLGGFPEDWVPVARSDSEGAVRIDLGRFLELRQQPHFQGRLQRGLQILFLQVEHPDHPPLSANVWIGPGAQAEARRIVLPESTSLEIRARRVGEQGLLRDLYPLMQSQATDWSEDDGVLTIRRIDLSSDRAARLLRIIHAPEQGPVLFSEVIDLRQHDGNPISIDVTMKPSVRVEGQLADQVPRPVQGGKVIAVSLFSLDQSMSLGWGTLADVAPDGTFVLESLPAEEHLQILAICDGWVSVSSTLADVTEYARNHGFVMYSPTETDFDRYQGVFPRLHRLTRPLSQVVVPMQQSSACEVAVLDQEGKPVPGATVAFSPQHVWFNGGSQRLGYGRDTLTYLRMKRNAGQGHAGPGEESSAPRGDDFYTGTTDANGIAQVRELAGGAGPAAEPQQFRFSVWHPDYAEQNGYLSLSGPAVTLGPGETGKTTVTIVRLQR